MRKRRKLLWQLYPSYLSIIVVSLILALWYGANLSKEFYLEKTKAELKATALLLAKLAVWGLPPDHRAQLDAFVKQTAAETGTRLTVVLSTGKVIADSAFDPSLMTNHLDRPEVQGALKGETTYAERDSYTLKAASLFAAVPVVVDDRVVAVARAARAVAPMVETLKSLYVRVAGPPIVITLLAVLLTLWISRRMSRTIGEIKKGAERFASGDLFYRIEGDASEETGALAVAMNRMAEQLHDRLSTITSQRNELEAVLLGMAEAVLVVDDHENVMRLNKAAETLFGVDANAVQGRPLLETVRNRDLRGFVRRVLESETPVEGDLTFPAKNDLFLQVRGSIIKDSAGSAMGAVVVLNDVTRLRTLEKIRKDFVANVSHELKTPVTSIKGFVETLREGAMDDPENSRRFLDIVIQQADRLSMIIEDLLSLSRIEQASEQGAIRLVQSSLENTLEAVTKACSDMAAEKKISLVWKCDPLPSARINSTLLEQALVNLVDNAVKFSEPGKSVRITCSRTDGEILIKVADNGCGIPQEHLSRIFERFYRVDKGRSREVGGTGLGLAIVKHIVNAHNGTISVESSLGEGTTFSIRLPAAVD